MYWPKIQQLEFPIWNVVKFLLFVLNINALYFCLCHHMIGFSYNFNPPVKHIKQNHPL